MRLLFLRVGAEDTENAAAWTWARAHSAWEAADAACETVTPAAAFSATVLWCHAGTHEPQWSQGTTNVMKEALDRGATVVLTLLAAPLGLALAGMDERPRIEAASVWSHATDPRWPRAFRDWPNYPHIRGFQGWGAHPLFEGLGTGSFTWMAREGDVVSRAEFMRPNWPRARVIAVDRSYVHVDADSAVAWEVDVGKGRVVCLGANLYFSAGDELLRSQRDAVLVNALSRCLATTQRPRGWPGTNRQHAPIAIVPRPHAVTAAADAGDWSPHWRGDCSGARPVTLGSPYGLMVGTTSSGVGEVWLTSLCVVGGGISTNLQGEGLTCDAVVTSPGHFERNLRAPGGHMWCELTALSPEQPEFAYTIEPVPPGDDKQCIGLEFPVPLRLQWPFAVGALVPLRTEVRREGQRATVLVTGRDGQHAVAFFIDGAESVFVRDDDAAPVIQVIAAPGSGLRMIARASTQGVAALSPKATSVEEVLKAQRARMHELRQRTIRVSTGRLALNSAFEGATLRLSNFMAATSTGARGLRAGFAASRAGWNASRPGYAWFFGRDACWSVDGMLCAGMFEEARDAIDLLARSADVTGKIIHELTTSGVSHYDAADSTPLFLRAVAAYAEWTGDRDALRAWWPAVARGFEFVLACDRDGDGLPENTGVGHGWIEMGPLGGGVVTSYVAAIWINALRRLAPVADVLGDHGLLQRVHDARLRAEGALESLRLPSGRLALHRGGDGHLCGDLTALAAVPIALGVDASSTVHGVLAELAGSRFSTPWGLRLLPNDDHRYDPAGYQTGSAWPLFTGWAALADCAVGNLEGALARVTAIAGGATWGGTGGFAEVLHGETGVRWGVCDDQAWSAAMALTPVVTGLAGIRPDALNGRCRLGAGLPSALPHLAISGLRVGASRVNCRWHGEGAGADVVLTVSHVGGPPLSVALSTETSWHRVTASSGYTSRRSAEGAR